MNHRKAEAIARELWEALAPYCDRIAVAGSIRRGKPSVNDIELVAIPSQAAGMANLFGEAPTINLLEANLETIMATHERVKNGPKYKKYNLTQGISLDLFIVTPPAQWGVIYAIRTGPADFSHWLVTQRNRGGAMPANMRVKDGALWCADEIIPTPEESDFFKAIGVQVLPPAERAPRWGVWWKDIP